MERRSYQRMRCGQASMMIKRRWRRFTLMVDQAPQSKNIRPKDAVAFQQALVHQMEGSKRSAYTGRVFLQMEFFNKSKTPPVIYTLPKNYFNLMERPRPDSGITRQSHLFKNDRHLQAPAAGTSAPSTLTESLFSQGFPPLRPITSRSLRWKIEQNRRFAFDFRTYRRYHLVRKGGFDGHRDARQS